MSLLFLVTMVCTVVPPSTTDEKLTEICNNAKQHVLNAVGNNMHCSVATKFFEGRVSLAGDAAHQWLPVRDLGLNTWISRCS